MLEGIIQSRLKEMLIHVMMLKERNLGLCLFEEIEGKPVVLKPFVICAKAIYNLRFSFLTRKFHCQGVVGYDLCFVDY